MVENCIYICTSPILLKKNSALLYMKFTVPFKSVSHFLLVFLDQVRVLDFLTRENPISIAETISIASELIKQAFLECLEMFYFCKTG